MFARRLLATPLAGYFLYCFLESNAPQENALWGADKVDSEEPSINHNIVTAMIKGDVSNRTGSPGPYTTGVDYGGNDMLPCGFAGCAMAATEDHTDCEKKCDGAPGCLGYVWADKSCNGGTSRCWTKRSMTGAGRKATCRDSRVLGEMPGHWAIKGGDAQSGKLQVYWDGKRAPGYAPMKKQGAIILGIGGDNSDGAVGTFFEGVMVSGYTSDATDDAVQANIVAAGYGR